MSLLPTRSFDTIVANIAAGMQGRTKQFLTFNKGSVMLAFAESHAGIALWLQALILRIVLLTRLSTSTGADVDSFLADLNIIQRIGSVPATGVVTFGRFTATSNPIYIPVGASVKTQDGSQVFQVYADTTNPNFVVAKNAYVMAPQITTLNVPVQGITNSKTNGTKTPGANGNVSAGAITLFNSSITGVDTVTNTAAFFTGSDGETDAQVKKRFLLAVQALSRGTVAAIENSIYALSTSFQVTVQENADLNGAIDNGMCTVIVDDGSGNLPNTSLAAAQVAANAVRAAGIRLGVYAAVQGIVAIQFGLTGIEEGYYRPNLVANIQATIAAQVNGLGLGVGLPFYQVASWLLAIPGVTQIDSLVVNGQSGNPADIPPNPRVTLKCYSVVVN